MSGPTPDATATTADQGGHRQGVDPVDLAEDDLERELGHLHETRHTTFLHGSADALAAHTARTAALEAEWLRRHPERDVDPGRTREGARERSGQA